ncbi:Eukaryotic translation initiation factor 4B3 like [Actinidia chinensis var. chinensis]|uniref:Eukaryotic translation initiation factor 4B3 like n=1 Tax=Actinidia chinensis var. chinensis TaxID=1590841 RepID=A0A2R6R6T3_ACTCC|nr:Eukaryotic translation initiation factor 4B3 like [Actinidia chinensis var. chinensis]
MAATVTSAWAKPGAWALDSEEHEAELLQQHQDVSFPKISSSRAVNGGGAADFPSLAAVASTKTKKKKPQPMSLSEFVNPAQPVKPKGLTPEDLMTLPTGPRERTAEELDRSRLGGGFRSYGTRGDESSNSRWGTSRGSDEPRRQGGFGRDSSRELAPSRADDVDDWAAKKLVSGNSFERRERAERGERGGFFGSESRADDSDSWVSNKSFVPSEGRRFEGIRERRVGFESNGGADSQNWVRKKEEEGRRIVANGGGAFDSLRERRSGSDSTSNGADSEAWGKKREEGSGSGGRPRLNLRPRTLPVGNGQQNGSVTPPKLKGSNPFGDARPREVVLKEKGQDWKELDEKLESMKIKEVTDGPAFGKRSFGSGNGRATTPEGRAEWSWRKPDSADANPSSVDKVEDGLAEEAEDVQERC